MPLSKARNKERMRLLRSVQPETGVVQPKLPWYAGAGDHFGEVKNKRYAKAFFALL